MKRRVCHCLGVSAEKSALFDFVTDHFQPSLRSQSWKLVTRLERRVVISLSHFSSARLVVYDRCRYCAPKSLTTAGSQSAGTMEPIVEWVRWEASLNSWLVFHGFSHAEKDDNSASGPVAPLVWFFTHNTYIHQTASDYRVFSNRAIFLMSR